tara:strand:+ start:569 stop:781 length:213 start_codon:yes stop_codon:yes gene_type:complete
MNPAAVQFAKQKAGEIIEQDRITDDSQNAKVARLVEGRQKYDWPGPGEQALYAKVDNTLGGKIRDGRFVM